MVKKTEVLIYWAGSFPEVPRPPCNQCTPAKRRPYKRFSTVNNWLLLERSFSRTICTFRRHSRKMNTTYPQLHDLYFVNLKLKFTKSYHRRSYRPATFCAFFGSNWRICDFGRRFWSTSADFHWKWIPRTHNSTIYILLIWSWNSQKAITEEVTVLQLFMSKLGSDPTWIHNFSTSDFYTKRKVPQ